MFHGLVKILAKRGICRAWWHTALGFRIALRPSSLAAERGRILGRGSKPPAESSPAARIAAGRLAAAAAAIDTRKPLLNVLARIAHSIHRFKRRHGLAVAGAVAAAAGGLSAVALAIAPLAPDAAELPRRVITETVLPLDVPQQLEALAEQGLELSHTLILRGPDSLGAIFRRAGVADAQALAQLAEDPVLRESLAARGARAIELRKTAQGQLVQLRLRQAASDEKLASSQFKRITARAVDGRWLSLVENLPLAVDTRFASGTIRSSLYAATDEAGLPEAVASQLAEIFASDIDFHRQLRKADSFALVYETLTADGEPVPWAAGTGRVLAAEFMNGGRLHQAIWFDAKGDGEGDYYDLQGRSRKRTFLASPLEFSRVTSGFALRLHPIFRDVRAHRGVDYGAPEGTPVRTVGDGVVEFAGRMGGYGNVVEVRHSQDRSTLYGHLSRIDVHTGQRVQQGQKLGAVGATGWATGPHLHFEFRIAGVHQDPLVIARQSDPGMLEDSTQQAFGVVARSMKVRLDLAQVVAAAGERTRFE
jgi:murein DD-endopeptidase MepM/ murein hydrolase activator NlpD